MASSFPSTELTQKILTSSILKLIMGSQMISHLSSSYVKTKR